MKSKTTPNPKMQINPTGPTPKKTPTQVLKKKTITQKDNCK